MSSDNISTKYKKENDRLRKERNSARTELQRVLREKNESYQNLNTEHVLAKEELQSKEREKSELVALFKDREEKDLQKLKRFEKDIETLRSKCRDDNEEMRQSEHEIESLKSKWKEDNDKIQRLEREIENLKSRLTGEKANRYSAYEMMQNKYDLETCKHQKKALEDERNELQKENMELENELQSLYSKLEQFENSVRNISNLKKQIKDHEEGFQKLTDSKETSEVLNKIIESLKQENSDLNQRLQQYAETFEDIPALKSHMDKLQSDNDDLNRKCRHLQTVEKDIQKLKREKQQLETEIISQRQNNETLNNRLEILDVEKLEIEDRLRRRSPQVVTDPRNCQNCFKYRNDISDLKREINDLRDRLSEAAGNKLRDNNPNIADLSDMNRPTSLAEKFSSLFTDEYTDAMEVIEDDMDEAASVKVMLDWLKSCYAWCQRLAKEQRETLINRSIGFMEDHGGQKVVLSDRCLIFVKEFQKKIAVESLAVVGQICHVKSVTQQTLSSENYIVKYIKKCSELCWMMQISDPPLYLNFDVNSGENLNKNDYNVFTKSGSKIDYLVWPVLYLHKTGPMLAKRCGTREITYGCCDVIIFCSF
ncbi:unnamed protein product [Mytilus edulis]|uniref:Mitochondria-eating protein C-terminal domain-containing protein n=1 Tax=Mytilus edulis TaxID=6550 RepID=A0A8S3SK75_MYTED|nr:unnamed protein product [Mytilus edulis]